MLSLHAFGTQYAFNHLEQLRLLCLQIHVLWFVRVKLAFKHLTVNGGGVEMMWIKNDGGGVWQTEFNPGFVVHEKHWKSEAQVFVELRWN